VTKAFQVDPVRLGGIRQPFRDPSQGGRDAGVRGGLGGGFQDLADGAVDIRAAYFSTGALRLRDALSIAALTAAAYCFRNHLCAATSSGLGYGAGAIAVRSARWPQLIDIAGVAGGEAGVGLGVEVMDEAPVFHRPQAIQYLLAAGGPLQIVILEEAAQLGLGRDTVHPAVVIAGSPACAGIGPRGRSGASR
jgi:hypothetical protein